MTLAYFTSAAQTAFGTHLANNTLESIWRVMKAYPKILQTALMLLLLGVSSCGGSGGSSGGSAEPFATLYDAADPQERTEREKLLLAAIVYDFAKSLNGDQQTAYEYSSNWETIYAYAAYGAPVDPADYTVIQGTTHSNTYQSIFTTGAYQVDGTVTDVQVNAGFDASDIGGIEFVTVENSLSFGDYGQSISDIPGDWNNCNTDIEFLTFVSGSVATSTTATASQLVFTPYTQLEYEIAIEYGLAATDLIVEIAGISFDVTLDISIDEWGTRENSEEGFQISLTHDLADISGQASINGISYTLAELTAALPTNDFTAFCSP